jgi:hypothetical protein
LEEIGCVLDSSCHRTNSILMLGDGDDKISAGKTNSRLDANKVVDV